MKELQNGDMCKVQSKVNEQQSEGDHGPGCISPPHPAANSIDGSIGGH